MLLAVQLSKKYGTLLCGNTLTREPLLNPAFVETSWHPSVLIKEMFSCSSMASAKQNELASVGTHISNDNYHSTILSSLSQWLATFASGQLAAACLHNSPGGTIDPEVLIILISDEWE